MWFHFFDHCEEVVATTLPLLIIMCISILTRGQLVALGFEQKPRLIDTPREVSFNVRRLDGLGNAYHICLAASSLDLPLSVAMAPATWSAIPVPADPDPKTTILISLSDSLLICKPAMMVARVMQPVP